MVTYRCGLKSRNYNLMDYSQADDWFFTIIDPDLSSGTSSEDDIIPDKSMNVNCYPNPFSLSAGKLTISVDNPHRESAEVEVYNIKGQKIKALKSDSFKNDIEQVFSWDGKDDFHQSVSTGNYIIRIRNSIDEITKKVIVVR